ncbi:MAG: DUF4255 domain-containing protein [Bacteroidota bacterium]
MNIKDAIEFIEAQIKSIAGLGDDDVHVDNVADEAGRPTGILITLVKVEEEKTLKNGKRQSLNEDLKTIYKNRPVHLNLYLLFSFNFNLYPTALDSLSTVVKVFQYKNVFTEKDGQLVAGTNEPFKMIFDMHSLSLEATNHLWGFLGGKQIPSVLYKVRLLSLEYDKPQEIRRAINTIDIESGNN